jgi:hypothetical protein
MARIRSIYPTTPTDPEFAANKVEGRLLFIYSLTIADDAGNLERNPLGLKMALFPADEWATTEQIAGLVDTLIAGRFYETYEADGKQYLHVRNFAKYQKPDHPTAPRYPLYPGQAYTYHVRQGNGWTTKTEQGPLPEHTPNVPRKNMERSRRKGSGLGSGLERKGKELDLEGRGTEKGTNGNDAMDPSRGPASPIDENHGNVKGNGAGNEEQDYIRSLSVFKRGYLGDALGKVTPGQPWRIEFESFLKNLGFSDSEINGAIQIAQARANR